MRVLQINASYKPAYLYGGPTMSVSMLAEQLVRAGINIEVFTTTANGSNELPVTANYVTMVDGVPVIYFKRITKDHTHFSPRLLAQLWKEAENYDVIHIHGWWNLVSILSCLVAVMRNIPVIVSPRGMLSNYSFHNKNSISKVLIHKFLSIPLLMKCFIHATSANESSAVEEMIKPKKIFNLPNFIKLSTRERSLKYAKEDYLKLIFFSRIEEKKGLDILLHALNYVTIPYHLTIAGDGVISYVDQLKKIAADNNLCEKIDWIGFQQENKFDILAEHDLMILPSHDENFGNVVIESLSVGTAVLISGQVGLADYVKENDFGWICQTDALSISERINQIYSKPNDLAQIREHAPAKISIDFNEDNLRKRYINMYDQVINKLT